MKTLTKVGVFFLLIIAGIACQRTVDEPDASLSQNDELSNIRMPFNQRVFFLNSANGASTIYEVDYDFQGLEGDATLTELQTSIPIPQGGHMCVSPDNRFLTVVVAKKSKVYLIEIETGLVKSSLLLGYKGDARFDIERSDLDGEGYKNFLMQKIGGITQVDVDQEGYLFIAGKAGFFRVVSDRGNGSTDPSGINTGKDIWKEIWNREDNLPDDQNWVHALHYNFSGGVAVESSEDGDDDDYFEEVEAFNPKKVKFRGGDILFTQNSEETDGFEQQRLISFSQWKGGTAIYLDLEWDYANMSISFNAGKVFGDLNSPKNGESGRGAGRVTGAALTGDNMVFTSHHKSNYFQLRTLDGNILASDILMVDVNGDPMPNHNWGDMASTQSFDKNTNNDDALSNREIDGEYYDDWYRGESAGYLNHTYAEVKLYRPGMKAEQYDVLDLSEDNHNVSMESRRNSANADIADYSRNGSKFVSLGGGYILMRFPTSVAINSNTVLQVVETTWNRQAEYATIDDAYNSYKEKAEVSILLGNNAGARYFSEDLLNDAGWVSLGDASVANNEFLLGDLSGEFQWVMINDNNSRTADGFDVNFVAAYDNPMNVIIPGDLTGLPCDITPESFLEGPDKTFDGVAAYQIPTAAQVVDVFMFDAAQRDMFSGQPVHEKNKVIGTFIAQIDGRLHGYEIREDCTVKGIRHQTWGAGGTSMKNLSILSQPKLNNKGSYSANDFTYEWVGWEDIGNGFDFNMIYTIDGEKYMIPFTQVFYCQMWFAKAVPYERIPTVTNEFHHQFVRHGEGENWIAIKDGQLMTSATGEDDSYIEIFLKDKQGNEITNVASIDGYTWTDNNKRVTITLTDGRSGSMEKEGGDKGKPGVTYHYKILSDLK